MGAGGIGSYVRASRLLQSMLSLAIVLILALLTLHAIVGLERAGQHAQRVLEHRVEQDVRLGGG